jgi:hypothetical protein
MMGHGVFGINGKEGNHPTQEDKWIGGIFGTELLVLQTWYHF